MMMMIAEKPWVQQSYLGDKLDRRTANNLGNQFDNNRESKLYQVGQKRKFIGAPADPIGAWAQKARFCESNPDNFLDYNVINSIFCDLDRDLIFGKKEFRDIIADQLGLKRSLINYERVNMVCGSFYIPKENEISPQGEDAHFVCSEEQTIGVADGVGGWAKCGIDAGEYARELMTNARVTVHNIRNNNNNNKTHQPIDPTMVLKQAYENTKSNLALQGSSTACILSLNKESGVLRAANVGDSGFMIFRDNKMVYKSPIMQKQFNFPYQLGNDVTTSDRVECAESFEVPFATVPGDVIVLGTDGLLDNVFPSEIEERLSIFANDGTNNRKDDCEELAGQIANSALYNSFNKIDDSPFSVEARKAGIEYRGGKIDDITIIVARVCRGRGISS